jgi:hypothetical protein
MVMVPFYILISGGIPMGISADFICECGYEAVGKWGIGMNPIYREQGISLAPALCKGHRP